MAPRLADFSKALLKKKKKPQNYPAESKRSGLTPADVAGVVEARKTDAPLYLRSVEARWRRSGAGLGRPLPRSWWLAQEQPPRSWVFHNAHVRGLFLER